MQLLALAGLAGVAAFVWHKGGIAKAAEAVGAGVVNAAGGLVTGGVSAVSESVGLPTPAQTTTDAEVARWIIDNVGTFEASKWAGAPAFLTALTMASGSGKPPAADSPAGRALLGLVAPQASYDETARLAARYPAPGGTGAESIFNGATSWGQLSGLGQGGFDSLAFPL
ncbi:hypothetical protein [Roseateles violae]|uniref:Uncharacterized protein n=1 Tax=Roseateles violae TaxID=3058042 RepID=A0ABT8DTR2_9BURK|nr:hypothetical protein [Pelomonas sp. PFR6]MDN3921503.1 hypothetical protein [Pelomonas sp. PFR6]